MEASNESKTAGEKVIQFGTTGNLEKEIARKPVNQNNDLTIALKIGSMKFEDYVRMKVKNKQSRA